MIAMVGNGAPGTIRTSDPQIRSFESMAVPGFLLPYHLAKEA
jgi:hypothetical protein